MIHINTLIAILCACVAALVVYFVGNELFETVENGSLIALLLALIAAVVVFLAVNGRGFVGGRRGNP